MRTDEDIAARQRHVLGQFTLNGEIALVRVGILEVLLHRQREGKHRAKAGEGLVVESLSSKLILRSHRHSWSNNTCGTNRRYWSTRHTDRALENLDRIQQGSLQWTTGRQNSLLLLDRIGDVGVEPDRQQRMVIENTECCTNHSLTVVLRIPGDGESGGPIVLVAREALLYPNSILCR